MHLSYNLGTIPLRNFFVSGSLHSHILEEPDWSYPRFNANRALENRTVVHKKASHSHLVPVVKARLTLNKTQEAIGILVTKLKLIRNFLRAFLK